MSIRASRRTGLNDLVGIMAAAALLVFVALPSVAHVRRLSKNDHCGANLRAVGFAAALYANENNERWMVPPSRRTAVDNEGIDYLASNVVNDPPIEPGEVGFEREFESTMEVVGDPVGGSTALSTTRAFWLLVRSGYLGAEEFICPASRDSVDPALVPEWYYDFGGYGNISYGYQVPFSPRGAQPHVGADGRMVFAADKGPFYLDTFAPMFEAPNGDALTLDAPRGHWRRFNSPNHHGQGQNVLFADYSVMFAKRPTVGADHDNIYTLMIDDWNETGFNRMHGESPHYAAAGAFPYPGQGAFGPEAGAFSSTDSLIYRKRPVNPVGQNCGRGAAVARGRRRCWTGSVGGGPGAPGPAVGE